MCFCSAWLSLYLVFASAFEMANNALLAIVGHILAARKIVTLGRARLALFARQLDYRVC